MNPPRKFTFLFVALVLGIAGRAPGAQQPRKPPESDLASIENRKLVVELAQRLAKVDTPESLADAGLLQPFNPPGFGLDSSRPVVDTAPGPVKASFGDREILNALAARVQPKGTLSMGSQNLLIFGKKNLRVGDRLTVSYEGQDYNLELVAFDRTNFTLRLNHEEVTRPIKPGKNP